MVHSIKLTRFKQFRETEIRLRPFSVLMGENNAGKTTVLQAIWLALDSLRHGKLLTIDRKTLQIRVSSTGYYIFDFPFIPQGDLSSLFYNKISREGSTYDESSGTILEIVDERQNCFRLHLRDLFKNLNVKLLTPAPELCRPELQNYEPLYISGFSGVSFQEERMFPAAVGARIAAGDIHSVVRNIVLDLKLHEPKKYAYLEKLLSEEFGFRIKEIHYYGDEEQYIFSEYEKETKKGSVGLDFSGCGSGMMQILQIIAVILRNCPEKTRVVLIDEPESHLHENLQIRLLRVLMRLQQELGIQMILATHSAAMICHAAPEDVIPILPYAPVNKGLVCETEMQKNVAARLGAYDLGRAEAGGKLAFFDRFRLDPLEKLAERMHLDVFSGVNTIPVVRGWRTDDDFPFGLRDALHEMLGREIEIHIVYDPDEMTEEELTRIKLLAEKGRVILHTLSWKNIENGDSERAGAILESFRADAAPFALQDKARKDSAPVRKKEYEQLTLLDI